MVETTLYLLLAFACRHPAPPAPIQAPEPAPAWVAPLGHDHPWLGRIWRARDGSWIDEAAVLADLREAQVVLLGEKHDNPDHHLLQARILEDLVTTGTPVIFEHLDHADPVGEATTPDALAAAVAWSESGWPDFALFEPIFQVVYARGATVVPGHPTRDEVRLAMSDGVDGLPPELTSDLPLRPLPDDERAELEQEIVASHCGMADPELVAAMVDAQVLKDAFIARAVEQAGVPAVVVAGAGHTRPDRGVPHYLDHTTRTVAFREVQDGVHGDPDPAGEADYLWFTARLDDDDPCERFREQLDQRFR